MLLTYFFVLVVKDAYLFQVKNYDEFCVRKTKKIPVTVR